MVAQKVSFRTRYEGGVVNQYILLNYLQTLFNVFKSHANAFKIYNDVTIETSRKVMYNHAYIHIFINI